MSADVAAYLPTLDDPVWVAWQAKQLTRIARTNRHGAAGFRLREQVLFAALERSFRDHLDRFHDWEWFDSIGGVITVDQGTESTVHHRQEELLRAVLADTERRIA
jgi:hypothetical protein